MASIVTVALYALLIAAGAWLVADERPRISMPRLGLAGFCALAFLVGPTVDGLEYEDAYVHTASAAWRTFHWLDSTNGYYSTVCFAGAVSDCFVEGSFGTQPIGFSILIAMVRTVAGNWPVLTNLLSATATLLTVQLVWTMLGLYVRHQPARLIGVGLLLTAPSYLLVSGSGFAEPLFSFLFTLCLYLHLRFQDRGLSLPGWALFAASGALMILAKKEGALLLLMIAVSAVWAKQWRMVLVSTAILVNALLLFGILDAADRHAADIGQAAFQLPHIAHLLPVLFEAAASPRYFGLLGVMVAPALLLTALSRDRLSVQLVVVAVAYTVIYSAHARHRFFVAGHSVAPIEMVRYVTVIAPTAALLIARAIDPRWRASWSSTIPAALVSAGLLLSLAELYSQRTEMAADEKARVVTLLDRPPAAIYVSPYSAALFAKADEVTLVVDAESALTPAVLSWLTERVRRGATIVLDPTLCESSAPAQWLAACLRLRMLEGKS